MTAPTVDDLWREIGFYTGLPEEHIALYRACIVENDFRKGRRIMSAMMPLMRVLPSTSNTSPGRSVRSRTSGGVGGVRKSFATGRDR